MDNAQLTKKQRQFFIHLVRFIEEHQRFPTYQESADHFNWSGPSNCYNYYQTLVVKGFLKKINHSSKPGNYEITPHGIRYIKAVKGQISGIELAISPDTKLQNAQQED